MNGIMKKVFVFAVVAAMIAALAVGLAACEPDETAKGGALRVAAPEGTPALAIARLVTDNKTIADYSMTYEVVAASNIAVEMSAEKADVVIMPVNAGANLIRQGAKYKLACVAVDGSLFMVGNVEGGGAIDLDDIVGKKVACIGQTGVPGLVFRYVMTNSGITLVDENTEPDASKNEVSVHLSSGGAVRKEYACRGRGVYESTVCRACRKQKVGERESRRSHGVCSGKPVCERDLPRAEYCALRPGRHGTRRSQKSPCAGIPFRRYAQGFGRRGD